MLYVFWLFYECGRLSSGSGVNILERKLESITIAHLESSYTLLCKCPKVTKSIFDIILNLPIVAKY